MNNFFFLLYLFFLQGFFCKHYFDSVFAFEARGVGVMFLEDVGVVGLNIRLLYLSIMRLLFKSLNIFVTITLVYLWLIVIIDVWIQQLWWQICSIKVKSRSWTIAIRDEHIVDFWLEWLGYVLVFGFGSSDGFCLAFVGSGSFWFLWRIDYFRWLSVRCWIRV